MSNKRLARDIDGLKRVFHQFWIQSAVRNKTSMRNLFLLFGVFLVIEGVFGADGVTAISANEGDDVPLEIHDAEVQRANELLWRIQGEKGFIARLDRETKMVSINTDDERFSGRVQMDKTTGSLTIKNINTADSGVYELEIRSRSGIKTKTFSLTVHSEVVIVEVSVMEGDSVTLNINDNEVQKDEELNWKVKPKDEKVYKSINDERFKTGETGSLTITNINIKDGGLYRLESSSITSSDVKYKAGFNVAVHGVFSDEKDGVKTMSEKTGNYVVLDTYLNKIQNDDISIEWTFGPQNISIAKIDGKSKNKTYNNNDVRFKNRLHLQIETGDLTIKNASSEHSGLYQLKIINNTFTIQKRFSVTVSDSGLSSGAVGGIVGGVLGVVIVVAAGVNYYQYTVISKLKKTISSSDGSESGTG